MSLVHRNLGHHQGFRISSGLFFKAQRRSLDSIALSLLLHPSGRRRLYLDGYHGAQCYASGDSSLMQEVDKER